MDSRDNDRDIVFKVRLNQDEWNALEAASQAMGYPKGTILRNYIQQLPKMERPRCKQPQ
jgi:hypothetical protein